MIDFDFSEVVGKDIHIKGMQDFDLNDLAKRCGFESIDEAGRIAMERDLLMYQLINPYEGMGATDLLKAVIKHPDEMLLIALAYKE